MSYFAQEPDLILLSLSFSNLEDGGGVGEMGVGAGQEERRDPKSRQPREPCETGGGCSGGESGT